MKVVTIQILTYDSIEAQTVVAKLGEHLNTMGPWEATFEEIMTSEANIKFPGHNKGK